jgi:acyl-lipid Delta6-acetylenase / acyl-lipid (9-3)-desaturase
VPTYGKLQFVRLRAINCFNLQGLSVDWWKRKHNTHHAAPNQIDEEPAQAVDPDIDTLPYLAWSPEMLHNVSTNMRHIIAYQHYYFFPLLMLARLIWAEQSIEQVIHNLKVSLIAHVTNM